MALPWIAGVREALVFWYNLNSCAITLGGSTSLSEMESSDRRTWRYRTELESIRAWRSIRLGFRQHPHPLQRLPSRLCIGLPVSWPLSPRSFGENGHYGTLWNRNTSDWLTVYTDSLPCQPFFIITSYSFVPRNKWFITHNNPSQRISWSNVFRKNKTKKPNDDEQ